MVKIYRVGGFVRDTVMGREATDVDYLIDAPNYEEMRSEILSKGYTIFKEYPEYFIVRTHPPDSREVIDFSLCHKKEPVTGRCVQSSLEEDLALRDFTMNAMVLSEDGDLIDNHGGVDDIKKKIIRCVGNPVDTIQNDPVRLLRGLRFALILGFELDPKFEELYHDPTIVEHLGPMPDKRKALELTKMFKHSSTKTLELFMKYPLIIPQLFTNEIWLLPTCKKK